MRRQDCWRTDRVQIVEKRHKNLWDNSSLRIRELGMCVPSLRDKKRVVRWDHKGG